MFFTRRFYTLATLVVLFLASGYGWSPLFAVGQAALWFLAAAVAGEALWLYLPRRGLEAGRTMADRFSLGDDNEVSLRFASCYRSALQLEVIDEIPAMFQRRDLCFRLRLPARGEGGLTYWLRPTSRGEFGFGHIRVYASTRLHLVRRRYTSGQPQSFKVYPSFMALRRYELSAISQQLRQPGVKRLRRVGHQTEFDQIKDYVWGDDFRTINWRATARRHQLMVNVYQDERSQQIVSVIDEGRVMQQTSDGMTLLDYAVNASLVLSYVAMAREDQAGLCLFGPHRPTLVPPSRRPGHIQTILETLYAEQTSFGETDYSLLLPVLDGGLKRRSLLVLYTNFDTLAAMHRQLGYLRQLSRRHRLLVVMFQNRGLQDYIRSKATTDEEVYRHVTAERYAAQQRTIAAALARYGIRCVLTTPDRLTPDVVNKYIELRRSR